MNQKIILYLCLLAFGIAAPFLFPAFKLQISIMWILVVLSLTWDVQGGQMGYNTFGNIMFLVWACIYVPAFRLVCFSLLLNGLQVEGKKHLYIHQFNFSKVSLLD